MESRWMIYERTAEGLLERLFASNGYDTRDDALIAIRRGTYRFRRWFIIVEEIATP